MRKIFTSLLALALTAGSAWAAFPQAETLNRGVIAVHTSTGNFISWRSLATDAEDMTFDVYRDGTKINANPITAGTNIADAGATATAKYVVKASVNGNVVETSPEVSTEADVYRRLTLDRPAGGKTPGGEAYTYTPNDMSVGDVDGDGQYEIFVKWDPSNQHDNSENGYTGNVYIDAYRLDGTKLWRIDLGCNIRAGAHYTQFMVYDFNQDGKAEMIVKTAPGTIDGTGKAVLMGDDKVTDDYRGTSGSHTTGVIMSGPEYLTVFNGLTGAEINTIAYNPPRTVHDQTSGGWGDSYANRSERYLACVAYLDGQKPSAVFCRGYYTHAYLWAVDFDGSKLTEKWFHKDTTKGQGCYGEGAHSLTVGDVDGDGKDEIVFGSACVDHDGKLLYRTGFGHGDALHLGDFDPDRDGLEVFMVHEEKGSAYKYDADFRDAKTGEVIWGVLQSGNDIGRGMVADLSTKWRGAECWPGAYYEGSTKTNATFDCKGNLLANKRGSTNFRIYWDGDLLDELFDGCYDSASGKASPEITKRNADVTGGSTLLSLSKYNAQSCNTTKGTPCLQADILGDWREELILWDYNNPAEVMLFTTTTATNFRVPCLMQDHNYRLAIAWQNCAYNQPPHLSFNLYDKYNNAPTVKVNEGALTQSVEVNTPIVTTKGTWVNATNATCAGLPEGVTFTADAAAKSFTIEGTPTKTGAYKYKIALYPASGSITYVDGTITVTETVTLQCVANWNFNQLGETVKNNVQGEAKVYGSPTLVEGNWDKAIKLNGTTDYLTQEAYDHVQMGVSDFTIEMLMKSTDDAAYIFHKGSISSTHGPGATGHWIGLEYKGGNLKFAIDDDDVKSEATAAGSNYFDGQWHHIVLVRETAAKKLKMYVDATLVAEATDGTGAINDNMEAMVIGNVNYNFDNFFDGCIDDLNIYRGAMSASKVADRYDSYTNPNSGIIDVNAERVQPKTIVLYDAVTGIEVARGVGEPENITSQVAPGIYILVTIQGTDRSITKVRL